MRILFSCFPGYGHLHPLLPLARAAQRAGHEVVIATGPGMAGRAAAFGFETWAVGLGQEEIGARLEAEFVEVPGRTPMQRLRLLAPLLFVEIGARPRVGEMLGRMNRWRPDVVVHEYSELSAPVAAGAAWRACGAARLRPASAGRAAGDDGPTRSPFWPRN